MLRQFIFVLATAALSFSAQLPILGGAEEMLLAVRLNGELVSEGEPMLSTSQGYYLTDDFYRATRLRMPAGTPVRTGGMNYLPLLAVPGVTFALDPGTQTLNITAAAQAFLATDADGRGVAYTKPTSPAPGLFLNHEFQVSSTLGKASFGGMVEGGFFSKFGTLTNQMAASNLTNAVHPIRLNTQFVRDFAGKMTTLTVGDSTSGGVSWSRQVFFAGVRYASNFSTQPGFLPTILPSMSGQTAVASTVDVYVDNVKQLTMPVNPGPFTIRNIPVISSQGDMRMVVTDMLGRQQVVTDSYIRSSQLLRPGVQEFSYEAGTLRTGFGYRSLAYRSIFAAGTQRIGVTQRLTLEGHQEVQPGIVTAGIGAIYALRRWGIVGFGNAASYHAGQTGYLYYGEFSHNQRSWGGSVRVQRTSADFRQLGYLRDQRPASTLLQMALTKSLSKNVNIAAGYLERNGRTEVDARALTMSTNIRIGRGTLTIGGVYSMLAPNQYGAHISWTLPIGERRMSTASGDVSAQARTASFETSQNVGAGSGIGYRVRTTAIDQQRTDATVTAQTDKGTVQVDLTQAPGQLNARLSERGAITFLQGNLLVSRWLNDSFAVVKVDGAKKVPIYVNNQLIAKTDRRGLALLPWLVPYNRNQVHVDDTQLPLDLNYDMTDRLVVPMRRSGVFLKFEPMSIGGATLILSDKDGQFLPQGTSVKVSGSDEEYFVAFRGEVFITELTYPLSITAVTPKGTCSATVPHAPSSAPLPKIGPLVCATH